MPEAFAPYLDLAHDAGLALTDAGYAYGLLVTAVPLLTLAGLFVLVGLIATHGKSHGTRFSALTLFALAALAGASALMLKPDAAAGTMLAGLLNFAWAPPLAAALVMLATMAKNPKPRAVGLGFAMLVALCATAFGGMLSVANTRALNPDAMTWLDAPPLEEVLKNQPKQEAPQPERQVLDTANRNKR